MNSIKYHLPNAEDRMRTHCHDQSLLIPINQVIDRKPSLSVSGRSMYLSHTHIKEFYYTFRMFSTLMMGGLLPLCLSRHASFLNPPPTLRPNFTVFIFRLKAQFVSARHTTDCYPQESWGKPGNYLLCADCFQLCQVFKSRIVLTL